MSDSGKAVFLSYASQDAEAAKSICEALRAAGIEVWFDQSELRGGDAWDTKIRKQIRECTLFIPIISANTQARTEGYFRLEWRLADQRTHLMAKGRPFVIPVVIDGTKDSEAHVPDSFLEVQWVRLARGLEQGAWDKAAVGFCEQVKRLLGPVAKVDRVVPKAVDRDGTRVGDNAHHLKAIGIAAAIVLLAAGGWYWKTGSRNPDPQSPSSSAPSLSEAGRLAARAIATYSKSGYSHEELAAAEEMAQRAARLEPTSAAGWNALAGVHAIYLQRAWDRTEKRREDAEAAAKRALAYDPNQAEALFARGQVFLRGGAGAEAEAMFRSALTLEPRNNRFRRSVANSLGVEQKFDQERALLEEAIRLDPQDPVTHYELASWYAGFGTKVANARDVDEALRHLDAGLNAAKLGSLYILRAVLLAGRGDLPGMRASIDGLEALPISEREEDRAVYIAMWGALLERDPARAIAAANLTAKSYFDDIIVARPKDWLLALAHQIAGRPAQAQVAWQRAEGLLREHLRAAPQDTAVATELAITVAWLGKTTEAAQIIAPIEALNRETGAPALGLARYYGATGDTPAAVTQLARLLNRSRYITPAILRLDPWWDKLRGKPEFETFVAEAEATASAVEASRQMPAAGSQMSTVPTDKSIAVLAFDDLSPAKDNESFSDGISEELLNVIGKVPNLRVVGRTSSFYFKGKQVPMPEMAKQLNVAYFVEGSVRRMGDQVRITAWLTKAADLSTVPLGNFNRYLKDIFTVQDEIAGLIAQNLSLKLGANFASAKPEVNPEAFSLYLQGRQAWNLRTKEGFDRAEDFFNRALTLDRTFSRAYSGLADVWILRGSQTDNTIGAFAQRNSALFRQVVARINEGLALDPSSAEAHTSLGSAYHQNWQPAEAERELRLAVSLNPNYATSHQMLSRLEANAGRIEEAVAEMKLATQLDPLSSRIADNFGTVLWDAGRRAEALNAYSRALELNPGNRQALTIMATNLATLGRRDEALALLRSIPDPTGADFARSARAYAVLGMVAEAESALRQSDPAYLINSASTQLSLNRRAEALASLDPAQIGQDDIQFLLYSSSFDPIRGELRFQQMLATLGLTEAHARAQAWRAAHPSEATR